MMPRGATGRTGWVMEGRPDNRPSLPGKYLEVNRSFSPINLGVLIYAINWTEFSRAGYGQ
jgi:hypothetical protein